MIRNYTIEMNRGNETIARCIYYNIIHVIMFIVVEIREILSALLLAYYLYPLAVFFRGLCVQGDRYWF